MRIQPNWGVIINTDEGDAYITDREGDFRVRCRPDATPSRMFQPYAVEIAYGLKLVGINSRVVQFNDSIPTQFAEIKNEHIYYWDSMDS